MRALALPAPYRDVHRFQRHTHLLGHDTGIFTPPDLLNDGIQNPVPLIHARDATDQARAKRRKPPVKVGAHARIIPGRGTMPKLTGPVEG